MSLYPPTLLGRHSARPQLSPCLLTPMDAGVGPPHSLDPGPLLSTTQGLRQPASEAHSPAAPISPRQSQMVPRWQGQLRAHLARAGRGQRRQGVDRIVCHLLATLHPSGM